MNVNRLNDAPVLDQIEGQWQKLAAIILFKLGQRGQTVEVTVADMQQLEREWPGGAILFVHGQHDSLSFKLVTPEEAAKLAAHDSTMKGSG